VIKAREHVARRKPFHRDLYLLCDVRWHYTDYYRYVCKWVCPRGSWIAKKRATREKESKHSQRQVTSSAPTRGGTVSPTFEEKNILGSRPTRGKFLYYPRQGFSVRRAKMCSGAGGPAAVGVLGAVPTPDVTRSGVQLPTGVRDVGPFPPCSSCKSSRSLPLVHVRRFSSVYVFCSMPCYAKFISNEKRFY